MQLKHIMTDNPICCTMQSNLQEVARNMVEHDCGALPVVENLRDRKPLGVITDRDITCRIVAMGRNPLELTAGDCMTFPAATVHQDTTLEECCELMELEQMRRMIVVDDNGRCCGIVAQADIAMHAPQRQTAHMVREVSEPAGTL